MTPQDKTTLGEFALLERARAKTSRLQTIWTGIVYAVATAILTLALAWMLGGQNRDLAKRVDSTTKETHRIVRHVQDALDDSIHDNQVAILINRCLILSQADEAPQPLTVLEGCIDNARRVVHWQETKRASQPPYGAQATPAPSGTSTSGPVDSGGSQPPHTGNGGKPDPKPSPRPSPSNHPTCIGPVCVPPVDLPIDLPN